MKIERTIILAASLLLLATAGVKASDTFGLSPVVRQIPERGTVSGMLFQTGSSKFSFIVPPGWRSGMNQAEKRILLQPADFGASADLRVLSNEGTASTTLDKDQLREQVKARVLNGTITGEAERTVGSRKIVSYELTQTSQDDLRLKTKVLFVSFENTTLEVCITAQPGKYSVYQKAIENLVASLKVE